MKNRLILAAAFLLGCVAVGPDSHDAADVSGTWREARTMAVRTQANVAADAATDSVADSVVYTLRINDQDGFVHGTWTIEGDTTLPVDPWEAVVTGDHTGGRLITEYYDPRSGQCRLAGPIGDDYHGYVAEQRCAGDQWAVADTFNLLPVTDTITADVIHLGGNYALLSYRVAGDSTKYPPDVTGAMAITQEQGDSTATTCWTLTRPDGLGGTTTIVDRGNLTIGSDSTWTHGANLIREIGTFQIAGDTLTVRYPGYQKRQVTIGWLKSMDATCP